MNRLRMENLDVSQTEIEQATTGDLHIVYEHLIQDKLEPSNYQPGSWLKAKEPAKEFFYEPRPEVPKIDFLDQETPVASDSTKSGDEFTNACVMVVRFHRNLIYVGYTSGLIRAYYQSGLDSADRDVVLNKAIIDLNPGIDPGNLYAISGKHIFHYLRLEREVYKIQTPVYNFVALIGPTSAGSFALTTTGHLCTLIPTSSGTLVNVRHHLVDSIVSATWMEADDDAELNEGIILAVTCMDQLALFRVYNRNFDMADHKRRKTERLRAELLNRLTLDVTFGGVTLALFPDRLVYITNADVQKPWDIGRSALFFDEIEFNTCRSEDDRYVALEFDNHQLPMTKVLQFERLNQFLIVVLDQNIVQIYKMNIKTELMYLVQLPSKPDRVYLIKRYLFVFYHDGNRQIRKLALEDALLCDECSPFFMNKFGYTEQSEYQAFCKCLFKPLIK